VRSGAAIVSGDRDRTIQLVRLRRWPVVLLQPRSKKPLGEHWQITTDADRVARHLRTGGNLGLVCSQHPHGHAVLDADELLGWADMIDTLGQPAAAWVETGSGKLHYYIAWRPDLPATLEWKGTKLGQIQRGPAQQQVVLPPSIHPNSGLRYRWIVDDPSTQPLEPLPADWNAYFNAEPVR
jgi:hypothetical protein